MRRGGLLLACLALAGCGSSKTVTIKLEGPNGSRTSTINRAALERCQQQNAQIRAENRAVEQHNREVRETGSGHMLLLKVVKLCLP